MFILDAMHVIDYFLVVIAFALAIAYVIFKFFASSKYFKYIELVLLILLIFFTFYVWSLLSTAICIYLICQLVILIKNWK